MALTYKDFEGRQFNLSKQTNILDQIMYSGYANVQKCEPLFQNDESLFAPQGIYDQQNNQGFSFKNIQHNLQYNKSRNVNEKMEPEMDSLDFNQFIPVPYQITKNTKSKTKLKESSMQCTFKPNILKKSSQIAVQMQPSFQRLTMPARNSTKKIMPYRPANKQVQKQYSKQRIQRLSKPRILKTQPAETQQYSKIGGQKKYAIPRSSNYMDVAARNQLWEEQKQLKIEKLRKQQEQIRLKKQSSTFAPRLTEYKGQKLANLSNFGKEGMANYFERLNLAKSKSYNYSGKQNNSSFRKQNTSPYCSTKASKTPRKDSKGLLQIQKQNPNQKLKYDDAVKQLHKKLMSLNI